MKIELNFQKFREAIQLVEKVAGKHMTLPVLSCLLIEVTKGSATLKATNLDVGVEVTFPVKSEEDGIVAVPAQILSSFVNQMPDNTHVVKIETISGNLQISAPKSKGLIKTVPHEDYPTIPKIEGDQSIKVSPEIFSKGLKSVWYASSVSSVKPELSSVYIYKDLDKMVFAATDSFRLAEKRIKPQTMPKINDILVPFKNIVEIVRILEAMEGEVNMKMNKNLVSFESSGIYLVSRLIDGVFPDYKQIIPKSFITEVTVLKSDLIGALKISNIFSDKFNLVRFVVDPKTKIFEISTKNSDIGENKTNLDASITGEKIEINFNHKYIVDSFQSIDSDSVTLQLRGIYSPT
jgi:DNA polymerase-3 subunit beta